MASAAARSINPVNWITPYKIDVIQGNFVSKEQVDSLARRHDPRPGQGDAGHSAAGEPVSRRSLGLCVHAEASGRAEAQSYKYTVFFKGDLLERFEGDTMPSEAEFIARLDNKRKLGKVPQLEATEEQLKAAERPSKAAAGERTGLRPDAPADDPGRDLSTAREPRPEVNAASRVTAGAQAASRIAIDGRQRPHGPDADRGCQHASNDCLLTGALDMSGSPAIGVDASAYSGRVQRRAN